MSLESKQLLNLSRIYREKVANISEMGSGKDLFKKNTIKGAKGPKKPGDVKLPPLGGKDIKASYQPKGEVFGEKGPALPGEPGKKPIPTQKPGGPVLPGEPGRLAKGKSKTLAASYNPNVKVVNEKKAAKDYDGDGKVESGKDEYFGSKDKAIKKAMGKSPVAIEKKERKKDELFGAPVNKEDAQYGYDKKGNSLNPVDKMKKERKKDELFGAPKPKTKKESFSNWRKDLQEVPDYEQIPISAKDRNKKIEEKEVKNTIKINPEFKEELEIIEAYADELNEADIADIIARLEKKRISKGGNPDESPLPSMRKYHADKKKKKEKTNEEVEIISEKEVDVKDTRRTVDAIRAYDRSKDASRDATYDTDHGKKKKGDKEKAYAKKERGEIDKDDPNWKKRKYHTGMHGESYEVKKKKEVMSALKKRKNLKKKVKEKIAADIVKRKGDTSKSDDRYAYESYGGEPIQGEGTKGKTKKEIKDLKKAAETGKGKYVAKADKVES